MSKTAIPQMVKMKLAVASGGRCQYRGCNQFLFRDDLTMRELNRSYIAHIVADEPGGPRGDSILSPQLAKELSNLMLLCDTHHRLIDVDDIPNHSVATLAKMKAEHELRIESVADIQPNAQSHVLLFGSKIGEHGYPLNFRRAAEAMLPEEYPAESRPIELSLANVASGDHEPEYWKMQDSNLRRLFSSRITPRLESGEIRALSVFALAPQPLLMLLGYLLGDITRAEIFQLHREPPTWRWLEHPNQFQFRTSKPSDTTKVPVLVFSLSGTVSLDRITSVLGD